MLQASKQRLAYRFTATVLVALILFTNIPFGFFEIGISKLSGLVFDNKVVDTLYISNKKDEQKLTIKDLFSKRANAAVATNSARTFYGDTTNAGTLKWATGASNSTGAEISAAAASASQIAFVRGAHAPTRDEVLVGHIKVDGRLDIFTVTGGQNDAADDTAQFNKTGVTSALTCDATTYGTCWRPFDVAYEALSGDGMVAFGLNATTGTLQYCLWSQGAWTPASCGTPSTFTLTGSTGALRFVRLIPRGEGLKGTRTDEILMVALDANNDIFAAIWDGSSWTELATMTTTSSGLHVQNFDGAWEETTGNALVVWSEGTAASTAPYRYKRWIRSTTDWDGTATSLGTVALSSIGHWVSMKGAPISGKDHIAIMTASATTVGNNCSTTTNCRAQPWIWTGGSSPSMTVGNQWGTQEPVWQQLVNVGVESLNTNVQAFYASSNGGGADVSNYQTWIEGTGFSAITDMTGAMGDDAAAIQVTSHPNTNEVFATGLDIDSDCNGNAWSGTAIGTWDITGCNSGGETAVAPLDDTVQLGEGLAFWVVAKPYSPWSRNWRWYGDYTENDPDNTTDALAVGENTTPDVTQESFVRLRMQFAELSAIAQTDARKKLQWTTGTPDSLTATWTDVGDTSETSAVWRYATAGESCANCADNTAIGAQRLTGSTQSGTYISDKDAAAGANMDHTASAIVEYDYPLKAEAGVADTTYYFRVYDLDQLTPVFREQDNDGSNDCSSAVCAYPSATVVAAAAAAPTVDTDAATGVTALSAVLNAEITATGGTNATERGFAWGTSSTLVNGGAATTTTTGDFAAGTFTQNVSGILAGVTYYFRAYATNPTGTGYGPILNFTAGTNNTPSRRIRLFEGASFKLNEGTMKLYQQ